MRDANASLGAIIAISLSASGMFAPSPSAAQPSPLTLIAQARAELATSAGDIWPGWDRTPFGVLLIDGEQEHLVCHPGRPVSFSEAKKDDVTGCDMQSRGRKFPPGLLAAMPAFGLPATVVVGTPAATGKSDAAWRATLLHEHFHQHQWTFPGYADRVQALGLSGGDRTGMWMLNYGFPYAKADVARRFASTTARLEAALRSRDPRRALRDYLSARDALAASVSFDDWRYAEFQLWQEGVARWTEITAAERSSDGALRSAGQASRRAVVGELTSADLAANQRVALYAMGAGEAMLLERCGSRWRARYPVVLAMRPLLQAALEDCTPRPVRARS